jgi:peptide/nickel transport system permease protein
MFVENKIGIIGLAIIVLFGIMAILHPILMKWVWDPNIYDPITGYSFDEIVQPAPPSGRHLLGTDPIGRDVLSQLMYSAQAEFLLGLVAAVVTVVVATSIGAVSAYFGGITDTVLMRIADIVIMLPGIAFLIVLGTLFELNMLTLAIVIGILTGFGGTAVVIKSQALSIKVKPYIEAARAAGGGHGHVIRVHLIPNLLPLAFLYMMFTVTTAIFSEAVLSFFGILNIRMSWGLMIHTAQTAGYVLSGTEYWWLLIPSGAAITLLCASFYLVGRALDEVVNPRLRRR